MLYLSFFGCIAGPFGSQLLLYQSELGSNVEYLFIGALSVYYCIY
nr:MAG TPA: hypothetical protein [Caudoviricetes sp.]